MDLFSDALIRSYVVDNPHFVERFWLADKVNAAMRQADCRFVLADGRAGFRKNGLHGVDGAACARFAALFYSP